MQSFITKNMPDEVAKLNIMEATFQTRLLKAYQAS
jgi:hypothetical protein